MIFRDLNLEKNLIENLESLGYKTLTPIQENSLKYSLEKTHRSLFEEVKVILGTFKVQRQCALQLCSMPWRIRCPSRSRAVLRDWPA